MQWRAVDIDRCWRPLVIQPLSYCFITRLSSCSENLGNTQIFAAAQRAYELVTSTHVFAHVRRDKRDLPPQGTIAGCKRIIPTVAYVSRVSPIRCAPSPLSKIGRDSIFYWVAPYYFYVHRLHFRSGKLIILLIARNRSELQHLDATINNNKNNNNNKPGSSNVTILLLSASARCVSGKH